MKEKGGTKRDQECVRVRQREGVRKAKKGGKRAWIKKDIGRNRDRRKRRSSRTGNWVGEMDTVRESESMWETLIGSRADFKRKGTIENYLVNNQRKKQRSSDEIENDRIKKIGRKGEGEIVHFRKEQSDDEIANQKEGRGRGNKEQDKPYGRNGQDDNGDTEATDRQAKGRSKAER